MWDVLVHQCVTRPRYADLQRGYDDYRINSRPCQRGGENQCAVRMSLALGRSGFGLESFTPRARVHDGGQSCGTNGLRHVLGAEELARFLARVLGSPEPYRPLRQGGGCGDAFARIRGRTGIIYFNNCFTRAGSTMRVGDHIDLFNGRQYYNEIIHPRAGGDETTGGSLFQRTDQVWFWAVA